MAVLSLSNIKKRFGPTVALDGVSLELKGGEVHALIGENGAGKSTLMNILAGAIRQDDGVMEVEGEPYAPLNPQEARQRGIALIHQELSLLPHLSVAENIMMGIEPARFGWLDRGALRDRTLEVLENFHHPEIRPDTRVGNLSVAAQQIVEISRALAARARIILMDEPTSSLQRTDVERLFALIRKLRDDGMSVIYISHFLEEVREVADRFTVLRDGRSVATGEIRSVRDEELISHMVGRPVENLFPQRRSKPGPGAETILEVRDLAAPPALKSASFELHRGEILGLAGLMGSGRTQVVRAIFALDKPESGTINLKGRALNARGGTPAVRLFQRMGYLSEDRKGEGLTLNLSLADNITMTRFASCSRWGWLNLVRQRRQAQEVVAKLGVKAHSVRQSVSTLSGGNQQKVVLARLLHQDAEVLLLDEPTRGIDIGSKVQVYEAIARFAEEGKAVLMVSSYLPELFGMCDRLAVMSRGRISAARPIEEWTPESVMQEAIGADENSKRDERELSYGAG
ncbi:MAG TPA: sugar ABC transporter ATP-binding protein [Pyrinomonadaceae bacterium]|nr:sugar ABC transporter ATP-binding protein [Pyrinomonadaceae bacterium]